MNNLREILEKRGVENLQRELTKPEFFRIVDTYFIGLNKERRVKSYLNFKRFWAENNHLSKDEAVTLFKKTKGATGYFKPLTKAFIGMGCATAKMTIQDLYKVEKDARRIGYTPLFPWPKYKK